MTARAVLLALVSSVALGCHAGAPKAQQDPDGESGSPEDQPEDDAETGESGEPVEDEDTCALGLPVATPLRRLTRGQYDNAVRDLLGVDLQLARSFPDDLKVGPFDSNVDGPVSELSVEMYLDAAEELAAAAEVDVLVPCALPPDDPDACAHAFIEDWGRLAFRRPLAASESDMLLGLYAEGSEDGFETGIRMVLRAALQSPDFLYVLELSDGELSGYELATRLSFFLWNTIPDGALLDAAEAGELDDPQAFELRARQMLDDPRASEAMADFHAQWFGTRDLAEIDDAQDLTPELVESMQAETDAFVSDVILDGDGLLDTLFGASHSLVDDRTAELYGTDEVGRVELDPARRRGVLTQPAVLASHTTVVTRGAFIRRVVLCQDIPTPPADVDTSVGDAEPGESPREHWEAHLTDPSCAGCHLLLDPLGWGFDHYDALGRWRDAHSGFPVDATGELTGTSVGGPFDGAPELIDLLLQTEQLPSCVTTNWWRYSTGRDWDESETCLQEHLNDAFLESGGDIRELLVDIATSDAFRRAAP